tara:strand:- start:53 stop:274 length:222 start_codon:yes stop_codon:yes gene_type:complete
MSTKSKRSKLKIASSLDAAGDMTHVTEKGYFLDPNGDAYINTPDGLLLEGGYDPDVHGLIVPLAKNRSKLKIA